MSHDELMELKDLIIDTSSSGLFGGGGLEFEQENYDLFWYWINERHQIYLKRQAGMEPPWTVDQILQKYFFTNVFRHLDKVSVWIIKHFIRGSRSLSPSFLSVVSQNPSLDRHPYNR